MRTKRHSIRLELAAAVLLLGSLIISWSRSLEIDHGFQVAAAATSGITIASTNGSIEAEIIHDMPIPGAMSTEIWSRPLPDTGTPWGRFLWDSRRHGGGFLFKIVFPHWLLIGLTLASLVLYFRWRFCAIKSLVKD